jgi:predicted 2-oxoglutarate/Fe(II)-dependent dioxygenase YbiX
LKEIGVQGLKIALKQSWVDGNATTTPIEPQEKNNKEFYE